MPDYKNSKIYKLWSPEGNEIYIGSTTQSLMTRHRQHRHKAKANATSSILFEKYTDVRIELLEECSCDDKEQLLKKESDYIKSNNNCVNKRIESNTRQDTMKKWKDNNKEKYKEIYTNYNEKVKEHNASPFLCECGIKVRLGDKARHQRSNRHIKLLEELKSNVIINE